MMYIGVRSCAVSPEVDNYWGSSKHLPKNVSEAYDKFILGTFDSRVEASIDEIRRHKMNDVAANKFFINRARATSTHFSTAGTKHTPEQTAKIKLNWHKYRGAMSEEHKRKLVEARLGYKHSEDTKLKIAEAHKGKKFSDEHKLNLSKAAQNRVVSEETKRKITMAQTGVKYQIVNCPHCSKQGGINNMKRYHFDNCKENK